MYSMCWDVSMGLFENPNVVFSAAVPNHTFLSKEKKIIIRKKILKTKSNNKIRIKRFILFIISLFLLSLCEKNKNKI